MRQIKYELLQLNSKHPACRLDSLFETPFGVRKLFQDGTLTTK